MLANQSLFSIKNKSHLRPIIHFYSAHRSKIVVKHKIKLAFNTEAFYNLKEFYFWFPIYEFCLLNVESIKARTVSDEGINMATEMIKQHDIHSVTVSAKRSDTCDYRPIQRKKKLQFRFILSLVRNRTANVEL